MHYIYPYADRFICIHQIFGHTYWNIIRMKNGEPWYILGIGYQPASLS